MNILILVLLCWRDVSSPVVIRSHCIKHRDQSDMDYRREFPHSRHGPSVYPSDLFRLDWLLIFAPFDQNFSSEHFWTYLQENKYLPCSPAPIRFILPPEHNRNEKYCVYLQYLSPLQNVHSTCRDIKVLVNISCFKYILTLQRRSVDVSSSILSYFWLSSSNRLV